MPLKTKADRAAYARRWRAEHPAASRAHDQKKREKPGAKAAATERMRQWRAANPEKAAEQARKYMPDPEKRRLSWARWRNENRLHLRKRDADWRRADRAANPMKQRALHLKRHYGLTLEDYEAMMAEQGRKCAACRKPYPNLHVDHCHTTNRIRGLLCSKCNTALGLFCEDVALMQRAADYLEGKLPFQQLPK